ncbi:MAG: PQQ-binding-like beta-propeller repeat protein [Vicinamibacterales bacterium]
MTRRTGAFYLRATRALALAILILVGGLTVVADIARVPYRAWVGSGVTAVDGDTLYMARMAGPGVGPAEDPGVIVVWDRATGTRVRTVDPLPYDYVYNMLGDPNGGVYVYADFATLARIGSDGRLDPVFHPAIYGVPLGVGGGRLAVARKGTVQGLQLVDRTTGATASDIILPGNVSAWAAPGDGTLLAIVGPFLIRLDIASGNVLWSATVAGPSTRTTALAASGPYTYLAVDLDVYRVDRQTGARTLALHAASPCGEGCPAGISRLTLNRNRLVITGDFAALSANSFLVLDADSGAAVRTTYPEGAWRIGATYAGGDRVYITGSNDRPVGALDATTFDLLDWGPDVVGTPSDMVVAGPYLIAAGRGLGPLISPTGSAAVRLSDGTPTGWQPSIDFRPETMVAGGGKVFAAGFACPTGFCLPLPPDSARLAQFDAATGERQATWAPVLDSTVSAMALAGSRLFVGGGFSTIDGQARSCLASFDVSGPTPVLESWAPLVSCTAMFPAGDPFTISAILPSPSGVFVTGRFTQVAGEPRQYVALIDPATGALDPWNLIADPASYTTVPVSLAMQGSLLVVGGAAVAGRAPAVFDVTTQQPLAAGPENAAYPGTFAAVIDSEIVLATGEILDLATGRLLGTRSPRNLVGRPVLVASSGIVDGLRYFPRLVLPSSPANLHASVQGHLVQLSWEASDAGPALGYTLEASATPDFTAPTTIDVGTALEYATTAPAGQYFVRVLARGTFGTSAPSNVVFVAPGPAGCTEPPGAPTDPLSVASARSFVLSWTAAATGGPVARYDLRAGTDPSDLTLAAFVLPGPSFAASAPAGTYYWSVRALNACGASAFTPAAMVTLYAPESVQPPTNLRATVASDRSVTLEWDGPAAAPTPDGYRLEAGSSPGAGNLAAFVTSGPALAVANVPAGTYYVQVRSRLAGALSAPSPPVEVVVP